MTFTEAIKDGFHNYVNFKGRAPRSAYWWWFLFAIIVNIIAVGLDLVISGGSQSFILFQVISILALLLPGIAVSIRRLHDTDRSGWWLLIALVPLIGAIVLIVFYVTKGTDGPNQFGDDPLNSVGAPEIFE